MDQSKGCGLRLGVFCVATLGVDMGMTLCHNRSSIMSVPFIDIHTHQTYADTQGIISVRSLRLGETMSSYQPYTLGLHPWFAEDLTEDAFAHLVSRISEQGLWGIGEAGLDRLSKVGLGIQTLFFKKQIALSEELRLPLVIHCVRAWSELLNLRKGCCMPWIIHGFRGKLALANQLIEAGCYLSFGQYYAPDVLQLAHKRKKLFLETDDSSLYIQEIYDMVAKQLVCPIELLCNELHERFLRLSV